MNIYNRSGYRTRYPYISAEKMPIFPHANLSGTVAVSANHMVERRPGKRWTVARLTFFFATSNFQCLNFSLLLLVITQAVQYMLTTL